MSQYKNMASEMGLIVTQPAPIQQVDKSEITDMVNRIKTIVPGGDAMTVAQITVIAQESILYRTVPGRDVHYFLSRGNLQRVYDYKYLKNFANFKEQLLSGEQSATIEEQFRPLTEQEKITHGIEPDCIAALCTIKTPRERRAFAAEVKQYLEMGFDNDLAIKLAKETYGEIGTSAVGVIDPNELDRNGKKSEPPTGWSFMQLAEKLAFKNAINRKYGIPAADEMQALAYSMAQRAVPNDWKNVDPLVARDTQAKLANLTAVAREVKERDGSISPDARKEEMTRNVILMRGKEENGIGLSEAEVFADEVIRAIPFFVNQAHVFATLLQLNLQFSQENRDNCFNQLSIFANQETDKLA